MGTTSSPPYIAKRKKQLQIPEPFAILTQKEQSFVMGISEGKSQTAAARDSFDVSNGDSAKSLGYTLMKNPEILEAITAILDSEGLTHRVLVRKLKTHVDAPDPAVSLKAVDLGLKLHDAFPAQKRMNLNIDVDISPVDLEKYR
ncbi:hypothetical protein EG832_01315 [bacterium]|nr:hypothetical protein [bacterium]